MAKKRGADFAQQRLNLLTSKPEFIQAVLDFRKKWKIPYNLNELIDEDFKNGIMRNRWDISLVKKTDKYLKSDLFLKESHKLISKIKAAQKKGDLESYKKFNAELKNLNNSIPLNKFNIDVVGLLTRFNLSNYYEKPLKQYLLCNNFNNIDLDRISVYKIEDLNEPHKSRLNIEIYAETTIKDVKKMWTYVKSLQKTLPGYRENIKRQRNSSQIKRDMRIYELHISGKNNNEIPEIIQKEFGGQKLSYDYVGIIINRFHKKIANT